MIGQEGGRGVREQEWRVNSDRTGGRERGVREQEWSDRTGGRRRGVREQEWRVNSDRTGGRREGCEGTGMEDQ